MRTTSSPAVRANSIVRSSARMPGAPAASYHATCGLMAAAWSRAVVGATRPELFTRVRELLPTAPLLVPGVGAQGGTVDGLAGLDAPGGIAPPSLIVAARSLLPTEPLDTPAFRDAVATSARALAGSL